MNLTISQNFLTNRQLVRQLIEQAGISNADVVLDIGAGTGLITDELAKLCKRVVAIELDQKLYSALQTKFSTQANVELTNADFLTLSLPSTPYKVFSNIPFNQTTKIIEKLLLSENSPHDAFMIIQEESAKRFMGVGEGTLVSLLLKPFFKLSIVHTFEKSDFTPQPNVLCVLFRAQKLEVPLVEPTLLELYRDFVSFIVMQQNSTLKKRIKKLFMPAEFYTLSGNLGLDPKKSITEMIFDQWFGLFNYFVQHPEKHATVKGAYVKYLTVRENQAKFYRTWVGKRN